MDVARMPEPGAIQLAAGANLTVVAGRCMGATHREDLHPLIPLLGDASTPAGQYVSYQK